MRLVCCVWCYWYEFSSVQSDFLWKELVSRSAGEGSAITSA